jgi:hypothetical protein
VTDQPVEARIALEEWPLWRLRYGLQVNDIPDPNLGTRDVGPGLSADLERANLLGRALTLGTAALVFECLYAYEIQRQSKLRSIATKSPSLGGIVIALNATAVASAFSGNGWVRGVGALLGIASAIFIQRDLNSLWAYFPATETIPPSGQRGRGLRYAALATAGVVGLLFAADAISKRAWTALVTASQSGNANEVRRLVEAGADVNEPVPWGLNKGATALSMAAHRSHLEVVRYLIGAGADVNDSSGGGTPLQVALNSEGQRIHETVELLLRAGANPNGSNGTPTLSAAALRSPRLVALLISAGADPNAADSFGNTPLMTAAWAGSAESVRLLLEAGARVDAHSRWGATALSSASAEDVIVLLKEAAQRGVVR